MSPEMHCCNRYLRLVLLCSYPVLMDYADNNTVRFQILPDPANDLLRRYTVCQAISVDSRHQTDSLLLSSHHIRHQTISFILSIISLRSKFYILTVSIILKPLFYCLSNNKYFYLTSRLIFANNIFKMIGIRVL